MTVEEFEQLLIENEKKNKESIEKIRDSAEQFNKKMKEILSSD